jgi:hypothetical protein
VQIRVIVVLGVAEQTRPGASGRACRWVGNTLEMP